MAGGKTYKGKTCAYCAVPASSTEGDHVVARAFFPPDKRGDLPMVPACAACNNEKSKLEHELVAVMPFGGKHADATETLAKVAARLARNVKLRTFLANTFQHVLHSRNGSPWVIEAKVGVDTMKLLNLYEYIARGLAFHHWGVNLPPDECVVGAGFLRSPASDKMEELLAKSAAQRENVNLGDGAFVYEGTQAKDCPEITIWRMSMYGVELGGDPTAPGVTVKSAYVVTAPKRVHAGTELVGMLKGLK